MVERWNSVEVGSIVQREKKTEENVFSFNRRGIEFSRIKRILRNKIGGTKGSWTVPPRPLLH
jgi:hypothetical protein